jgi:hypothetical protein
MKIRLLKKNKRNALICLRTDGSTEIADLGPSLPFHDIAHFVVENQLNLKLGLFGHIDRGYSVAELSTKEIIKQLPPESMISESITRALGSLLTGACTENQFNELVALELESLNINEFPTIAKDQLKKMLQAYKNYTSTWESLPEGAFMKFELNLKTVD